MLLLFLHFFAMGVFGVCDSLTLEVFSPLGLVSEKQDACCDFTTPYIQVTAEITTADPPLRHPFNVPLFAIQCPIFHDPAEPALTDGVFIPSTAVGVSFLPAFVDSTGNQLDEDVYSAFLTQASQYLDFEPTEDTLFSDYVVCSMELRDGKEIDFRPSGFNVGNTGQMSVTSYRERERTPVED